MKNYIFITVVLTTALSGYGDGSTDGEICSASSSGEFRLIEGELSCGDEEEIKKTIYEAVKDINPDIELSIEFETKIYRGPESTTGNVGPTTANVPTAESTSDGTLTPTSSTVEGERTITEASITPTSTPEMTNAVITEDSTVMQTTKLKTSTATTPEMTTLTTTEKTTADIQTTQMVTTQLVRHNGSVRGACERDRPGPAHFWVSRRPDKEVTFEKGRQICRDCNSVPAVIPDKDTSDAIYEITNTITTSPQLWTGTTFDPKTGDLSPPYSYRGFGSITGKSSETLIALSPNSIGGVMQPHSPTERIHGIVCWKPKS